MCHNFTVEMYIFLLYSLTSAQWSKIAELILGYRCATTVSFESVMERNICDGKENVCDGKDILVYNNNYQHKSKVRG